MRENWEEKEGSSQAAQEDSCESAAVESAASESADIDQEIARLMEPAGGDVGGAAGTTFAGNPGGLKKKKRRKRILIAAAVVLLIVFAASRLLASGSSEPVVQTAVLTKGDIQESISVTGPIEGTDSVDVTSNLHAKVVELNVKEGDRVEAGQTVLARLDTTDLEKQLEIAQGNYDLAVATKEEKEKEAQRNYEKAVQDLNAAQDEYNRKSALAQSGDVAQVELETAANALNDARRAVSAYDVKNGKVEPDESLAIQENNARLELEQVKDKMEDAVILAPINGTVTRVNTKVGLFADDLDAGQALITIENLDELQMEIKVSEYSIGSVKTGQPVKITADILGADAFVPGEVASISPTGEEKGSGSTERVIPTKIRILENAALMAGITAKAEIVLRERKDTYVVPISAVGQDASGAAVMQFVRTDASKSGTGTILTVPVELGIESDLDVELLQDPLAVFDSIPFGGAGAQYLTTYNANLTDGMTVKLAVAAGNGALQESTASEAEATSATAAETEAEPEAGSESENAPEGTVQK